MKPYWITTDFEPCLSKIKNLLKHNLKFYWYIYCFIPGKEVAYNFWSHLKHLNPLLLWSERDVSLTESETCLSPFYPLNKLIYCVTLGELSLCPFMKEAMVWIFPILTTLFEGGLFGIINSLSLSDMVPFLFFRRWSLQTGDLN